MPKCHFQVQKSEKEKHLRSVIYELINKIYDAVLKEKDKAKMQKI
jgi:hypothetical protein